MEKATSDTSVHQVDAAPWHTGGPAKPLVEMFVELAASQDSHAVLLIVTRLRSKLSRRIGVDVPKE